MPCSQQCYSFTAPLGLVRLVRIRMLCNTPDFNQQQHQARETRSKRRESQSEKVSLLQSVIKQLRIIQVYNNNIPV